MRSIYIFYYSASIIVADMALENMKTTTASPFISKTQGASAYRTTFMTLEPLRPSKSSRANIASKWPFTRVNH